MAGGADPVGDSRRGGHSAKRERGSSSGARAQSGGGDVLADISLRDVANTAKVAFDVAKEAIALLNPEEKVYEVQGLDLAPSLLVGGPPGTWPGANTNPFVSATVLDAPTQGVAFNQREGDSLEGKGIELVLSATVGGGMGTGSAPGTPSTEPTTFRVLVIQDEGAGARVASGGSESLNTATNAVQLLSLYSAFGSAAHASAAQANLNSVVEWEYKPQFRVLLDELFTLDPSAGGPKQYGPKVFKIPHKQVKLFVPGSSSSANISTQLLVMTLNPNSGTWNASNEGCRWNFFSRFKYIDN